MDEIVDIDKPDSWPSDVAGLISDVVESLTDPSWREYPYDHLGWSDYEEEERRLRDLLADHRLVGYHATRLLPHEISQIRKVTGLEVLSDDLRERKVDEARSHYPDAFIGDDSDGEVLLRSGPNDWQGTADVRLGYIDFVAPFALVEHNARGLMNLLDTWGGETLGWLRKEMRPNPISLRLTALSEPAIIELAARVPTLNLTPLLPAFAGRLGEVPGAYWHQWRTTETIPPRYVLGIITPRSERWPATLEMYRY